MTPDAKTRNETEDESKINCWNCPEEFEPYTVGRPVQHGNAAELCPNCGAQFAFPPIPENNFNRLVVTRSEMPTFELPADEVTRRLPAVSEIRDRRIRSEVIELSQRAPAYFWWVPASTSGYHHPLCRGEHGLWAHSLMVVTAIDRLWDSYVERDLLASIPRGSV